MKFRTKTEMMTATFQDVLTAAQQGTITEVMVGDTAVGGKFSQGVVEKASYGFLIISGSIFAVGAFRLWRSWSESRKASRFNEPLLPSEGVIA